MTQEIELPRELHVATRQLGNGLTVVVHEDRKAPIVGMSLWYRVGSGHEPPGRHGFAHLFEHLMFSGSEHVEGGFFNALAETGAKDINGTTWFDRTNYFVTVPVSALDRALWVESDRMGHLLSDRSQAALDTQRGVIVNEKMEGDARPYGAMGELSATLSFPPGHPYAHTTIGSMSDLRDSDLADVHRWYVRHYGAANATLVLAGAISPEEAFQKVETFFGNITPGPRPRHPEPWIAVPAESQRVVVADRVPAPLIQRQWNCPPWGHDDHALLELAARVMSSGAGSRLYDRLVVDTRIAVDVSARIQRFCVTSPFGITVRCSQLPDVARAEQLVDEELARFLHDGPSEAELELAVSAIVYDFAASLECVGGMGGQAATLAEGQCLRSEPSARWRDLSAMRGSTPADVLAAAKRWLSRPSTTVVMVPEGANSTGGIAAVVQEQASAGREWQHMRSPPPTLVAWRETHRANGREVAREQGMPIVADGEEVSFPQVETARLASGETVCLVRRPGAPLTELLAWSPTGFGGEALSEYGLHRMAMSVALEGPQGVSAATFQSRKRRLGISIGGGVSADTATLGFTSPAANFDQAVSTIRGLMRSAAFEEAAIARFTSRWEASVHATIGDPSRLVSAILPSLIFGEASRYGHRGQGNPTLPSIAGFDRRRLSKAMESMFQSEEVIYFVCGDVTLDEVARALDRRISATAVELQGAMRGPRQVLPIRQQQVYVVDFPNAQQVAIAGGFALPTLLGEDPTAWRMANEVLGGSFHSRLNQNLREQKSWAYGAGSGLTEHWDAMQLTVSASVQADKALDALDELRRELSEFSRDRLPNADELQRVRRQRLNALGGRYETVSAVVGAMAGVHAGGEPLAVLAESVKRLQRVDLARLKEAAEAACGLDGAIWVLAGDVMALLPQLRERWGIEPMVIRPEDHF